MQIKKEIWADRYPFFCINLQGMHVVSIEETTSNQAYVKFKEPIPECEEWDNSVVYNLDDADELKDYNYIKSEWEQTDGSIEST